MPSHGPNTADVVTSVSTGVADEESPWGTPENTTTEDSAYATMSPWVVAPDPPAIATHLRPVNSAYLHLTDFDFAVPDDEYVTQITVTVRRKQRSDAGGTIVDWAAKLVIGGAVDPEDLADTVSEWNTSLETKQYVFTRDLAASVVNAVDFGFALSVEATGENIAYPEGEVAPSLAQVDLVTITLTTAQIRVFVDSVQGKWCYEVPSSGDDVKHQYVSFSPLGVMLALRSSGHIDELEWDHSNGSYIEGVNRDGGRPMPDGFWESQEFRGGNRRLNMVGLDKGADDAVDVTAECDRGSSTQTLSAGDRHARFPVTQQGYSHKVRIEVTEDTDGIERCQMWFTDLSDGWKR